MDNDDKILNYILLRLPQPKTLELMARLRRQGYDWQEMEERMEGVGAELAEDTALPFHNNPAECERYVKRMFICAFAREAGWMN